MIKEFITQWENNKGKLEKYFRNTKQEEYCESYEQIVRKIFEICIIKANDDYNFDLSKMTIIDDGDYQGTQIYIIPNDSYQPEIQDYVITNNYYGSCSGCDTLLSLNGYSQEFPNEEQVQGYMTIALHLVQKLKWLGKEED